MSAFRITTAIAACALLAVAGTSAFAEPLPRPAHVIVVIEENRTPAQVIDSGEAPYIASLARRGAFFTHAHGVTHPSLPNYFALFSGRTNTNGDGCPATGIPVDAPNLSTQLRSVGLTFVGYAQSLPHVGFTGCFSGRYARKHAPWVHFANVPAAANRPLATLPPFAELPTVAFVVPNLDDDMHDGTIAEADAWAAEHIAPLVKWAMTHDTLIVFTWDEGYDRANSIPVIFIGPMVKPGRYAERVDHYRELRTLEALYGLAPLGRAATVAPITDVWR